MKPELDQLLETLERLTHPTVSLDQVTAWTRTGRQRPRFYLTVWLSRIWKGGRS